MECDKTSPQQSVWKLDLYKIQLEAPTPKPIARSTSLLDPPEFYGYEYHGLLNHREAEQLLSSKSDGSFLIRRSPGVSDFYTLSLRFDQRTRHYKIYYNPFLGHFLKEDTKRFETIHDLVADGIVTFYMQRHAAPILQKIQAQSENNYAQSPYMTLNRKKLRALSNDLRRRLQMEANAGAEESRPAEEVAMEATEPLPVVYENPHQFKTHNFKGLNWCELCGNFLWGFTAQGVKCEPCGFIAHVKCSELVPPKCVPDLKRIRGVFGVDLTTLVAAHKQDVPFIILRCVREVEERGMTQEGIYRVSGFADEIDALKLALDRDGEAADMSERAYSNINVIAGVLKLYLRLLPIPLITFQAYPALIRAADSTKTTDEQVRTMKEAFKLLPPAHFNSLRFIIEHLARVAALQSVNKMTEHNLSTVFAPTLIATPPQLTDLTQEIFVLSFLIGHCQAIFP